MLLACQLAAGSPACAPATAPTGPEAGRLAPQVINASSTDNAVPEGDTDEACLRGLDSQGIAYKRVPTAGGMRTPVEIGGPLGAVTLVARGRRSAVMDCVLARALVEARDIFEELGITGLAFSAAFDQRTRRGSSELSAHAYGLAIDVHVIRGTFGEYDVRQRFERGVGLWRGLKKDPGQLDACVGQPVTREGRVLRLLACRLKLHPAFRVIVTPDDDLDHQDHLHLEAGSTFYPPPKDAPPLGLPPESPPPVAPKEEPEAAAEQRSIGKHKRTTKRKQPSKKAKQPATKKKATKKKAAKKPPQQKPKPTIKKKGLLLTSRSKGAFPMREEDLWKAGDIHGQLAHGLA